MTALTNAEWREAHESRTKFLDGYAFAKGCSVMCLSDRELNEAGTEALRRYPDPVEPTIVTDEDGTQYRINPENGKLEAKFLDAKDWRLFNTMTVSFLMSLGQLAQEYYERTK